MFSCSSFQSYSLVHCSVLSVSVTASVQYLIPSSSYPFSLFICFLPPSLSFITLMKKMRGGGMLWRYSEGAEECWQRRCREMKRDGDQREGDRKLRNMKWCSPAIPTDKILVLCKRGLKASENKGVMLETALKKFIICRPSKLNASTYTCGIQASHTHTQLQSRGMLIKPCRFLPCWHSDKSHQVGHWTSCPLPGRGRQT